MTESVTLTKGGNVNLTKQAGAAGLTSVTAGLGWSPRVTAGADFDLDASAFVLGADGKVLGKDHFVYYGNLATPDKTVVHSGDNLTGVGDGDDEQIVVNLLGLGSEVDKVVIVVTIYEAAQKGQNFGQVADAYIRVVNDADGAELTRYDLSEDASTETGMAFGEFYRKDGEWKFRAVGQGHNNGLDGFVTQYGLTVG